MPLSEPNFIFGIHSISPYRRTDGVPYGIAKVVGKFSTDFSGEQVPLNGGSSQYPWAVEQGPISSEISITFKEYAAWMYELFLGKAPTSVGVDATGTIANYINKKGTSIKSATTGIDAVAIIATTGKDNLKFGKYVIVAVSTTTVDVYALTDADFNRGAAGSFLTDALKIAAAQSITTGADTNLTDYGIKLTGGSGTIGMTVGDSAVFEVRPPSSRSMEVVIGGSGNTFPEFGCIAMAQKRGTGELVELDIYRVKGSGLPMSLAENAWSEAEVKASALYDASLNGVYKLRRITP